MARDDNMCCFIFTCVVARSPLREMGIERESDRRGEGGGGGGYREGGTMHVPPMGMGLFFFFFGGGGGEVSIPRRSMA
jgi:hypothetical protein